MARQHQIVPHLLQQRRALRMCSDIQHIRLIRLWKQHQPRIIRAGDTSPQFAIDKIAQAPRRQAKWHQRRNKIRHFPKITAGFARVPNHRDQYAQKSAVERHTALPNLENIARIGQKFRRFIKQHIAQTPAENHAQYAIKQDIVQLDRLEPEQRHFFRAVFTHEQKHQKRRQIGQAVPMHRPTAFAAN